MSNNKNTKVWLILLSITTIITFHTTKTNAFIANINKSNSFKSSSTISLSNTDNNNNNNNNIYETYSSTFDKDIPSGIRGEAMRSSIRSPNRGIWYKPLDETDLNCSMIHVHGKGTIDFLNSKLSSTFCAHHSKESCILNQKGKVFDKIIVSVETNEDAYIITSPYSSNLLYDTLNNLIFPLDQVSIKDVTSSVHVFVVASTKYQNTQSIVNKHLASLGEGTITFPSSSDITYIGNKKASVISDIGFPRCALQGYTIYTFDDTIANTINKALSLSSANDSNVELPLLLKKREYESLRIEVGIPSFGHEFTSHMKEQTLFSAAQPLELLLKHTIDYDKGCYLGQEQVSSMIKNKLGPPRTMHTIIFYDDMNEHINKFPNQQPKIGHVLYALGSNQTIKVGYITSVAEAGGTGKPYTIALCLLSRSKSILNKMKYIDLEMEFDTSVKEKEGIVYDSNNPLNGLDVIINNTYTIGKRH